MILRVLMVDGPVTPGAEATAIGEITQELGALDTSGFVGAALRFEGIVRGAEADQSSAGTMRALLALDYQTYDPMAQQQLCALGQDILRGHGLQALCALHSRGRVSVGEVSFVLAVWSSHRAEALAAVVSFIDQMKRDVPIWKRAIWAP